MSDVQPGHKVRIGDETVTAQEAEILVCLAVRELLEALAGHDHTAIEEAKGEVEALLAWMGRHDSEWMLEMVTTMIASAAMWGHLDGLTWARDRLEHVDSKAFLSCVIDDIGEEVTNGVTAMISNMN